MLRKFSCILFIYSVFQAMALKQPNSGLFVGLSKGHIVTKKELAPRPSDRKGVKIPSFPIFVVVLCAVL